MTARVAPLVVLAAVFAAGAAQNPIRQNSVGFLPLQPKQASVAAVATNFVLLRQNDAAAMFTGQLVGPRTNADTGESLFTADFSAFTNAGTFQLEVPGVGRSAAFRIADDVYREAFVSVTRGMYLWRCGCAVSGWHGGKTFSHAACHTNDAWLDFVGGGHVRSNATGGWHDAGDYNKYVVNAGVAVGCMFRAWEDFGPAIRRVELNLPERGGAVPEFLAEIKWELDWLLTMQAPDGSVYHKLSTRDFGAFILPEKETAERYFTPWSSAATADFVAMLAAGARNFREFDPAYAARCLAAAEKSHRFLIAHPESHRADQSAFTTGGYPTRDDDDRLWAAAELWAATGNTNCLADCEARARRAGQLLKSIGTGAMSGISGC
jgi:endoglucanase